MGGLKNSLKIFHKHANLKYKNVEIDIDLHPFSWIDIIKLLLGNEFGILPDSFLLIKLNAFCIVINNIIL